MTKPWTLAKAQSAARPGDVINLLAGSYPAATFSASNCTAGTPDEWITYQSYPDPYEAKFSSISFESGRRLYTRIIGIDVECLSGRSAVQVVNGTSDVTVKDCRMHGRAGGIGPSYANVLVAEARNVTIEGCEIYYSGTSAHGVQLESSYDVVVRGCHVHDIVSSGIRTGGGQGYVIEYNRVHDQRADWNSQVHGSGISIHSHYTTIRGNIVYDYGNSRPIRFYQSWAGPNGYHDMLVENNLVFKTPQYSRTMWWPEFIDVGPRCVFRNNTFLLNCWIYFAQNADGTGLSLHNNIFAGGLTLDNYGTTSTLRNQTSAQSRAKWDLVSEGNNIFRSLNANGCGYLCSFGKFSQASSSRVINSDSYFGVGSFFESSTGEYPYRLSQDSPAIDFGDPANAPPRDLSGHARDAAPDAGCYERTGFVGNRPPVLNAIGNQRATVGTGLTLHIVGTDPDGDLVRFAASHLPEGAQFTEQTFIWTPTSDQIGTHEVVFTVSDGQAQDSETITITVERPNAAPILGSIGDRTTSESQALSFSIGATDADGDPIMYSAIGIPSGASLTGQVFSWTPTFDQAGSYEVTFVADDGRTQASETITIVVANVNRPPDLGEIGDRSVDENNTLSIAVSALDPDGDRLTYSAVGLPIGATLTGQTFTWTPDASQTGSHEITFTVTDGALSASESITVMVVKAAPDNAPPTVARCSPDPDAIQVPLNNLVSLHISDAGTGVDAKSVLIAIDDSIIYRDNLETYVSESGRCSRSGTKNDYRFIYQANALFDFDHRVTVAVSAADMAGNAMEDYAYTFTTEMRAFGSNVEVGGSADSPASRRPVTTCDNTGNLWVAWHAGKEGGRDIYVAKRPADKDVFEPPMRLTDNPHDQCNPDIAAGADGYVYVVWQDDRYGHWDIFSSVCTDGRRFSRAERVTDLAGNEINPAVAVGSQSGKHVYVAWQDDRHGNQDIYIAGSDSAFAASIVSRITSDPADQSEPDVAVDAQNAVYVIWTDMRNGRADIYGAVSSDGAWTNVPIVTGTADQTDCAVAAEPEGSLLHLVWVDNGAGNEDVQYAWSNGLPAGPLTGIGIIDDTSGAKQLQPSVGCGGDRVFACWQDARNIGMYGADTDLYFAELSAGTARTNILVGDGGTNAGQMEPAVGIDGHGQPYVVWADERHTATRIYYAGATFIDPIPLDSMLVVASAGATIGTQPAEIAEPGDVSIVVPRDACPMDIRVTISRVVNPRVSPTDCLGSYDFGPSGIDFDEPVTVTIPYRYPGNSGGRAHAFWYDSLTGALSQQGITDIETVVISPNLHALQFKTMHFTPYYLVAGDSVADSSPGAGGCSISTIGGGSPEQLLVPYGIVATVMAILKNKDRRRGRSLGGSE